MSRLFRFLILGLSLLFCYNINAQVTLELSNREVTEGERIEVQLRVADFGQITKIDLSLEWDTSFLAFNSINPENIGDLNINNFNRGEVDNGAIGMEWEARSLPSVSIPDGNSLFTLTFTTKKAGNTKIDLSDFPIPVAIVRTTNVNNPFDLRDLTEDDDFSGGNITINPSSAGMSSPPPSASMAEDLNFTFTPDEEIVCIGDQVCYSIAVENFDSIISFQFPLDWDPAVLEYDRSTNFNLENFTDAGIVATQNDGILRITYEGAGLSNPEGFESGFTVPDGTSIVDLCFNVIGENNNQQNIFVGPDSRQLLGREAVTANSEILDINFEPIPVIETLDCDQTVILNTVCNSAGPGEQVCVDIQPFIFRNVGDMLFSLNWDPSVLSLVEQRTNNPDLDGLGVNAVTGSASINWSAPIGATQGVTLSSNGSPIATLCFDIQSNVPVGSLIDISFANDFFADIDANPIEGRLNPCAIEVIDPIPIIVQPILPEPILNASSEQVEVGNEVCVDILVEDFTGITAFEFPVSWDNNILDFKDIRAEAFAGINIDSTTASDGRILVNWGSATGREETLPGQALLVSICFNAKQEGSTGISFFDTTADDEFFFIENVTLTSTSEAGLVTILPDSTPVVIPPPDSTPVVVPPPVIAPVVFSTEPLENLSRNESTCIPVTVDNFSGIFSATILVQWDSTVLEFDTIINSQLPSFPTQQGDEIPGQLIISWVDINFNPFSLDNGEAIFDICFTTKDDLGASTEISFPDSVEGLLPGNPVFTEILNDIDPLTSTPVDHIDEGGEVQITTFGIESFTITDPACDTDGNINAIIAGGQDGYTFFWTVDGIDGTIESSDESSLTRPISSQVENISLTVFSPSLDQNDTDFGSVNVDDTRIPTAIANINGLDTLDVGCVDPDFHTTELLGDFEESPDAAGGVITSEWTAIGRGSIEPFSDTLGGRGATARGIGTYVFTLTNASQCTDSDTLVIVDSAAPTLSITPDNDELTCDISQLVLTGTSSDMGAEFDVTWTNSSGDTLSTGTDPFQLEIEQGGIYSFSVNNSNNGCTASEPILINENISIVNAEAGSATVELRCEDDFITLDGSQSDTGGNFRTEWTSDNDITRPLSLTPDISKVGTYFLRITDNTNGCFGTDSILVIADTELPVAKVRDEAFIGCNQSRTVLRSINDGLDGTSVGAKFEHTWTTVDGVVISEEDTAEVSILGEYLFIVVNTENDACVADTARVQVLEDTTLPVVTLPNSQTIGCDEDCIDLIPETDAIGADFSYTWITTDVGEFCGDINSLTAQTNQTGTYSVIVRNNANNCVDTASTIVFPDPDNGIFAEAGPVKELTCDLDSVIIGSAASSSGAGITYEWRFEEEEEVISEDLLFTVREAGRYRLTVIDAAAQCQGSGSVEVTENKDFPIADAGSDFPLDGCVVEAFRLVALNSEMGDDIIYQWSSTDGEIISDETSLTPTVNQPGVYTLVVTNTISGCSSTDDAVVSTTVFSPAAIVEETERSLDCNDNTIILDATNSITEDGINTAIIEWTTVDGNIIDGADTKSLVVDSAGTYILTLTADNGCEDRATVVVTNTAIIPEIDAGEGFRLTCNEQMTLDASNSPLNDNLVIQWTTNDGSIVAGANTLMPEINLGGTYTLAITDTTNNCRVEDVVIIESDGILPSAQAGENIEVCGREADLSASPATEGITGIWTALNGGQIDADDPLTNAAFLSAGENQFVWTLSSDDCPDFSADTVTVNALTLPIAEDDEFEFVVGQGTAVSLDLVGNDIPNTDNFSINIIQEPTSAILNEESEGVFSFDLPSSPTRQDFQYEICSATCSDVCASATVRLVVRPDTALDSLAFTANAITPNGDGLNDVLIFDELFIEDFPQSELVIFNRWGDVIYKVSPYNNDWEGSGIDGAAIAEGTYYYILRLDISEGDIIRGDVTVLR